MHALVIPWPTISARDSPELALPQTPKAGFQQAKLALNSKHGCGAKISTQPGSANPTWGCYLLPHQDCRQLARYISAVSVTLEQGTTLSGTKHGYQIDGRDLPTSIPSFPSAARLGWAVLTVPCAVQ